MNIDWWTFSLETINFLILMVILHRFLYKPVLEVISRRKEAIATSLSDAEGVRREADEQLALYEARQAELAAEREALMARDREASQDERHRILEQARTEAEELTRAIREQLADERRDALVGVREHAAKVAVVMAETLLRQARVDGVTEMFFERACEHLESRPGDELQRILHPRGAEARVRVVTAQGLSGRTQDEWRARLLGIFAAGHDGGDDIDIGKNIDITFAQDEALIAGVAIELSGAEVRFAWGEALRAMEKELMRDADAA